MAAWGLIRPLHVMMHAVVRGPRCGAGVSGEVAGVWHRRARHRRRGRVRHTAAHASWQSDGPYGGQARPLRPVMPEHEVVRGMHEAVGAVVTDSPVRHRVVPGAGAQVRGEARRRRPTGGVQELPQMSLVGCSVRLMHDYLLCAVLEAAGGAQAWPRRVHVPPELLGLRNPWQQRGRSATRRRWLQREIIWLLGVWFCGACVRWRRAGPLLPR